MWGWIKRWFDPVTVSKIFILGKAEVKPTLERFMDPKDIPTQYGGQLEFKWGDLPHLDDEAKKALEQDGNSGWITGPCLWLDHKRVVVGSENGKLRRSVSNVEKLKPVVYAADDTEEPVHPNRRASSVTSQTIREKAINGTTTAKLDRIQSENVVPATAQVAAASAVPAEANMVTLAESAEHAPVPETTATPATAPKSDTLSPESAAVPAATQSKDIASPPAAAIPADIPPENLRTSPAGNAVNMPPPGQQPAFPQQTAEYINTSPPSTASAEQPKSSTAATTATTAAAAGAAATAATTVPARTNGVNPTPSEPAESSEPPASAPSTTTASPPPHPAMPQPGPLAAHEKKINSAVAEKLLGGGESVSTIPAVANGSAVAHPEVVVSSDASKGLALEQDKIDNLPKKERPQMDRFVTAAEF